MLRVVQTYRWELWLFFGVPVISALGSWLVLYVVDSVDVGYGRGIGSPISVVAFVLLGVSYWWVSLLLPLFLRVVWQYAIAATAIGTVSYAIRLALDIDDWSDLWTFGCLDLLWFIVGLVALVYFARRASRGGFDKAFALIGISAIIYAVLISGTAGNSPEDNIGITVLKVIATLVAVWVTHHADTTGPISSKALVALLGLALAVWVWELASPVSYLSPLLVLIYGIPLIGLYGVVTLVTYLVRVPRVESDDSC